MLIVHPAPVDGVLTMAACKATAGPSRGGGGETIICQWCGFERRLMHFTCFIMERRMCKDCHDGVHGLAS